MIREITEDDLQKLTQIPMIRITRFDASKADDAIVKIEAEMEDTPGVPNGSEAEAAEAARRVGHVVEEALVELRLTLSQSSDFYGRVVIYSLDVEGVLAAAITLA